MGTRSRMMKTQSASKRQSHILRDKCRTLRWALLALMAALCCYVFRVQVLESDFLAAKSENQKNRFTYIPARRGAILDRNGEILNQSIPQYDLAIRLDRLRDPRDTRNMTLNKAEAAISELGVFLGPQFYMYRPDRQALERHILTNTPLPFVLWTNMSPEDIARLESCRDRFPYAEHTFQWCRDYSHGHAAAQLRGFVHRVPIRPTEESAEVGLLTTAGDMAGAAGMEKAFDGLLSGESGYQILQTDVMSFLHDTVQTKSAIVGGDVKLTLDIRWQEIAERHLEQTGHPGAMVMMDTQNGDILILASTPSHHLPPLKEDANVNGAYMNRALSGTYPPGSTLKPFIALAALEQNLFSPDETVYCPGFYELPDGRRIRCSSRFGHGPVTVTQALAVSCNTFFCEAGVRLMNSGFRALVDNPNYNQFFGTQTGAFPESSEIDGVFFTPQWVSAQRRTDPVWHTGDATHAGIGQGGWIVTPLQMARYACAITTGKLFRPRMVADDSNFPVKLQRLRWEPAAWRLVLQGLMDCVNTPTGTGRRLASPKMKFYAKTGTAEHVQGKAPHAWMFAVFPTESPRYAVACVVEGGGHGGEIVAPLLRKVLEDIGLLDMD